MIIVPDFRSPDTGLYANLARLDLDDPEDVFNISFFRQRPEPFYALARELFPGKHSPTLSHAFLAMLAKRGLLLALFTQNIDCLERAAGVPADLIIEAHGSFASQRCIECREPFPDDDMRRHVERGEVPRCKASRLVGAPGERPVAFRDETGGDELARMLELARDGAGADAGAGGGEGEGVPDSAVCNGLVKPDIVFFGEPLPKRFFDTAVLAAEADLVLVLGTSLKVYPFGELPRGAGDGVPRVLFNNEQVGDLGRRADDVLELGDCDAGVRKLAAELGWLEELEKEWAELVGEEEAERQRSGARRTRDVEDEVEKLTHGVEEVLKLDESKGGPKHPRQAEGKEGEEHDVGDHVVTAVQAPAETEGPKRAENAPVSTADERTPAKAGDSMD